MVLSCPTLPRAGPFKPCCSKINVISPRTYCLTRQKVTEVNSLCGHGEKSGHAMLDNVLRVTISGMLASGMLYLSPFPASADLQTVSPQVVTQMARPLPKQTVDKGKVWTLFIGGAVVLFATTVAAENNPSWFPAISRANQAMKISMKQIEENEKRAQREAELLKLRQEQYDSEQRQLTAVQQGLKQARTKVLGTTPDPATGASPPAARPVPSTIPPTLTTPTDDDSSSHSISSAPAPSAASSPGPYVVVEEVAPDMGAVAWPSSAGGQPAPAGAESTTTTAAAPAAPAAVTTSSAGAAQAVAAAAGAAAVATPAAAEDDAEALARLSRLQGFVSGTMAGGKGAMEAYKAQRQ